MKTGMSLVELAKELERQKETKRDFISPTQELEIVLRRTSMEGLTNEIMSMREADKSRAANLLGMSQRVHEGMAKISSLKSKAEVQNELSILHSRLCEAGDSPEKAMREMRKFIGSGSSRELPQASKSPLALQDSPSGNSLGIRVGEKGIFDMNEIAHQQVAGRVGIPQKYYDRMRGQAPELLAQNVNHWFKTEPEKRMVRTLDGRARAFLSDRYRPLDNYDLGEVAINTLVKHELKAIIESTALTDKRLYIKARTEIIQAEVKKGDIVQAGIIISNSEVGMGSVKVEPFIFRLVCLNGLIANDHALRKYHVGRGHDGGDLAEEFFRDETRKADDRAFWMKVRDIVSGSFKQDVFDRMVQSMRNATQDQITQDPVKVVEVTQKMFGLNDTERGGVLSWLIKGGDLTRYGLVNAVTRTSQDVQDYDRATDLERLGGQILELPKSDWQEIAEAA